MLIIAKVDTNTLFKMKKAPFCLVRSFTPTSEDTPTFIKFVGNAKLPSI